jgi:uncharacterized protein
MRRLGAAVLLAVLLSGCTTAVAGQGTPAPAGPSATASPTTAAIPCAAPDPSAVVTCLVADVSRFWTAQLRQRVGETIVVDPARDSVPSDCRPLLELGTAFYCTDNRTVYLTAAAMTRSRRAYGSDLPYALAAVVGHEFGHVVQDAVHQPGFNTPGDAASRRIEQQADCLLGVWAHDAAARALLVPATLRRIAENEYQTVEDLPVPPVLRGYDERATHGTVAERITALTHGLVAGTTKACNLAPAHD